MFDWEVLVGVEVKWPRMEGWGMRESFKLSMCLVWLTDLRDWSLRRKETDRILVHPWPHRIRVLVRDCHHVCAGYVNTRPTQAPTFPPGTDRGAWTLGAKVPYVLRLDDKSLGPLTKAKSPRGVDVIRNDSVQYTPHPSSLSFSFPPSLFLLPPSFVSAVVTIVSPVGRYVGKKGTGSRYST
jgi:hypothetical protein